MSTGPTLSDLSLAHALCKMVFPFPLTDCTGRFMADPNSKYYIPDSSIQASSEYLSLYKANMGRLHGTINCWIPDYDPYTQPWIQADLGRLVNVSGIQTQGGAGFHWITTLKVSTFHNEPGIKDVGDFIQDGNKAKVGIKQNNKNSDFNMPLAYLCILMVAWSTFIVINYGTAFYYNYVESILCTRFSSSGFQRQH